MRLSLNIHSKGMRSLSQSHKFLSFNINNSFINKQGGPQALTISDLSVNCNAMKMKQKNVLQLYTVSLRRLMKTCKTCKSVHLIMTIENTYGIWVGDPNHFLDNLEIV